MDAREKSADIDQQAAEWVVRIDDAPLSAVEQRAFDEWIKMDSRRAGAYIRARAIYIQARQTRTIERARPRKASFPKKLVSDGKAALPHPRTRRWVLAGLGSAAAASGLFLWIGTGQPVKARTWRTGRGEIRQIPLGDQRTLTLNTLSEAHVRLQGMQTRITLPYGEARLDIVRDSGGPVTIELGDYHLQVVDSCINLRRLPDDPLEILVGRGAAKLSTVNAPERGLWLPPQSRVRGTNDMDITIDRLDEADIARRMAWLDGMLYFADTPLRVAAREFERYSVRRIMLREPGVADETVTGIFAANDPGGFARSVALSLGLHVDSMPDKIILSRPGV
ncbi:MAG: DUF4880 domain-containing protein [Sphingomonadaceae bacterium]